MTRSLYCKTQEKYGILYAQDGDYRAAEETLKNYHGSLAKLHDDSTVLMERIGIDFSTKMSESTGGRPATDKRRKK